MIDKQAAIDAILDATIDISNQFYEAGWLDAVNAAIKAIEDIDETELKEQEPKQVDQDRQCEIAPNVWLRKGFCPECHQNVYWFTNRCFCGSCGQAVKWDG